MTVFYILIILIFVGEDTITTKQDSYENKTPTIGMLIHPHIIINQH